MLGKLFKHEAKYYLKWFIPFYIILLGLSAAIRIVDSVFGTSIDDLGTITAVPALISTYLSLFFNIGAIGVPLIATFIGIFRFNKSVFSSEGYLTNTLPVSTDSLILSKFTMAVAFYILTKVVVALTWQLAYYDDDYHVFSMLLGLGYDIAATDPLYAFLDFISSLAGFLAFLLMCYLCLAFRSATGIGNFVTVLFGMGLMLANFVAVAFVTGLMGSLDILEDELTFTELVNFVSTAYYIIISAGLYFITRLLLKDNLNLE